MLASPFAAEPVAEPLASGLADAAFARVPETLLHRAWADGAFDATRLTTSDGLPVVILDPGRLNLDSGPDFMDARVAIGGMRWAGSVEIHRSSADWEAHGHHTDPAYDTVVLHVVLSPDRATGTLRRADGTALPELVLMPHFDQSLRGLLHEFATAPRQAPYCAARWGEVPPDLAAAWIRTCGTARLRAQTERLAAAFGHRPDLDHLLVRRAFRALGYEANADAMEALADRLPWDRLRALDDPRDVLALVVGAAGWLDPTLFGDDLADRWTHVGDGLTPVDRRAWHTGGRPANRPPIRLAQAAALVAPHGAFGRDAVATLADDLRFGPHAVCARLRQPPPDGIPRLGMDRARDLMVNAVLPVLALDAEIRGDGALAERVVATVARLPAQCDRITRGFAAAGARVTSALDAHGLHHLARTYCDEGRCDRCAIGQHLARPAAT